MFINSRLMSAVPALSLLALSALAGLPAFADCPEPAVAESSDAEYTRAISSHLPFMGKITEGSALSVSAASPANDSNSVASFSPKAAKPGAGNLAKDRDALNASLPANSKAASREACKLATAKELILESAVVHAKDSNLAGKALTSKCKTSHKEFTGLADYYHHSLYGQRTSSGQILHKAKMTAAHRTLPFGTKVRVTNKRSGRSCVVVINDRGPFTPGKVIDLSHAAAIELDVIRAGTAMVACTVLED